MADTKSRIRIEGYRADGNRYSIECDTFEQTACENGLWKIKHHYGADWGEFYAKTVKETRLEPVSTTAYNVYLKGKLIDTVFQSGKSDKEEVKKSLVDHDGYDPEIVVTKARGK